MSMITATAFGKITKEITYDQITYNNSSTPVQTARVTISCYNVSAPKDAEYKTMFITVNVKGWNAEYLRKNNVGKGDFLLAIGPLGQWTGKDGYVGLSIESNTVQFSKGNGSPSVPDATSTQSDQKEPSSKAQPTPQSEPDEEYVQPADDPEDAADIFAGM